MNIYQIKGGSGFFFLIFTTFTQPTENLNILLNPISELQTILLFELFLWKYLF